MSKMSELVPLVDVHSVLSSLTKKMAESSFNAYNDGVGNPARNQVQNG